VFAINTLAPYLLTALVERPERLIYLSSGMHEGGDVVLDDLQWVRRRWRETYPGWVPTKMGGCGAPGDLGQAHLTQVWLATGSDTGSGGYYYHRQPHRTHPAASDHATQDAFLDACAALTGVRLAG
jgi:hypothetical protein